MALTTHHELSFSGNLYLSYHGSDSVEWGRNPHHQLGEETVMPLVAVAAMPSSTPPGARRWLRGRCRLGPPNHETLALCLGSAETASMRLAGPVPSDILVPSDQNRTGDKNRRIDPGDYAN
jgi:hypothetical protein